MVPSPSEPKIVGVEYCQGWNDYAGMGVAELRRLKQLEDENRKLKSLVADLTLDKHMLPEVVRKKF